MSADAELGDVSENVRDSPERPSTKDMLGAINALNIAFRDGESKERAAVVAYLRAEAAIPRAHGATESLLHDLMLRVERGEHRK